MIEWFPYNPSRIEKEEQQALITVIVPVYNVEKYLSGCIDSLLAQTYGKLEILLVDDGSTDGSGKVADEAAAGDTRIRVIHKENGGAASARNRGIEEAKGEWVAFADADDRPDPDMYERMLLAADAEIGQKAADADLVITRARWIREDNGEVTDGGSERAAILTAEKTMEEFLYEEHDRIPILNAVWNKLYRKELLAGIRFDESRWYEDIMFTTRVLMAELKNGGNVIYLDHASYNYSVSRKDSYSGNGINPKTITDQIPIYQERRDYFRNAGRADLADIQDYYFYKRLLDYCSMVHRSSISSEEKSRMLASLRKVILGEQQDFETAYRIPGADPEEKKRMDRYLKSEKNFFAAVDRNEDVIVPMKRFVKRLIGR